jgi:exonuclease III
VVAWRDEILTRTQLRDALSAVLINDDLQDLRIRLCTQLNGGGIRTDIRCSSAKVDTVIEALKSIGYRARKHIPYVDRHRGSDTGSGSASDASSSSNSEESVQGDRERPTALRICSLNINGLRAKKIELAAYLKRRKIDVACLQETRHEETGAWELSLNGYQVVSRFAPEGGGPAARGLVIACRRGLVMTPLAADDDNVVWVKIVGGRDEEDLVVGCVYVPIRRLPERAPTMERVWRAWRSYQRRFPRVVLVGDFNATREQLTRAMTRHKAMGRILPFRGSAKTYHRGLTGSWTGIDHAVTSGPFVATWASHVAVDRRLDLSDHWPIHLRVDMAGLELPKAATTPRRLKLDRLKDNAAAVLGHNRFAALLPFLESEDPVDIDQLYNDTIAAAGAVADELELVRQPTPPRERTLLRQRARRAIRKRRALHSAITTRVEEDQDVTQAMRQEYSDLCKEAKAAVREDSKRRWLAFVSRGTRLLVDGRQPRAFWQWMRSITGRGKRYSHSVSPLMRDDGQLLLDPQDILAEWASHYERLGRDETGHSRDFQYWSGLGGPLDEGDLPPLPDEINRAVTWIEIKQVLREMRPGKAAGHSGIPAEWWRLVLSEDDDREEGTWESPQSPMAKVLAALVTGMVERAEIPAPARLAHLISIPKKGDPQQCTNYRGISLIEVLLKVASTLVIRRVYRALEARAFFSEFQGGFRTGAEAMGHVITLHEVCHRRRNKGLPTFLAFVDIKKAFDTVPHGAMFRKLERAGVHGMVLRFIRAVYADTQLTVRLPFGCSPPVPLHRGVRQGCPMSPTLFNVFINDVVETFTSPGVSIPGMEERLHVLLFADDLVVFAESAAQLHSKLDAIRRWADINEMRFGASKCGVMKVDPGGAPALGGGSLGDFQWDLHGAVAEVASYTYLGVEFANDLSLTKAAEARAAAVTGAIWSVRDFLWCLDIPVAIRTHFFNMCVMGVARFGGELLGMNKRFAAPVDRAVARGLRLLAGFRMTSRRVAVVALREQFGVPSAYTAWSCARLRVYQKYAGCDRWVSKLIASRSGSRQREWASATRQWMASFATRWYGGAVPACDIDPEDLRDALADADYEAGQAAVSADWFKAFRQSSKEVLAASLELGLSGRAVRDYIKLRLGGYPLFPFLVRLPEFRHLGSGEICPCCLKDTLETASHVLTSCDAWAPARAEFLGHLQLGGTTLEQEEYTACLLGGESNIDLLDTAGAKISWNQQLMRDVVMFLANIAVDRQTLVEHYRESMP